ncbi:MAG: M15 family metallopeptidase [Butyricicoccus sp.]
MKRHCYLPIPVRLASIVLSASFLMTYGTAANKSDPETKETISISFPVTAELDTQMIEVYEEEQAAQQRERERLREEREQQALYDQRAKDWKLLLVNADNPISDDYAPDLADIGDGMQFDRRASKHLLSMIEDGQAAGYNLFVCSAYRDNDYQQTLYDRQVDKQLAAGKSRKKALRDAARIVAAPGTSEHATGLAADIITQEYASQYSSLTRGFEQTDAFQWLNKHCTEYGFILRYAEDKTDLTGVIYEPWHFRYVGTKAANEIMDEGLCLEEYLGKTES